MWVIVAVGCGSDDGGPAPELWCDGVCTAVARCGLKVANCSATCVQQNPELASRSASGAAAQKPCLTRLSCDAVGGNETAWQNEQKACWEQAVMSVVVTDRARQLCPDHARAWFECGYTLSLDDCEHIYSMWSDAVIDRVALCDGKQTCDELESCEQDAFANL
jgi:hypothetical protein